MGCAETCGHRRWEIRELQQWTESVTVRRLDIDHGQVVDDDVHSGKAFRHIRDLAYLVRSEEDIEHGSEFFRVLPQRVEIRS